MMTEEHEKIIAAMDEFYRDYSDDVPMAIDLAVRTCDAFGLFPENSYRVPEWVLCAAKMIISIHEEEKL